MNQSGATTARPIAELALEADPFGVTIMPQVLVVGEPPVLFVQTNEWNQWTWGRAWWHVPDVAALGACIALICLLRLGWNLLRGRRVVGRVYCKACGHELVVPQIDIVSSKSAAWASDDARCPECGKREMPVVARRVWRSWKALSACVLVLALCGTAIAWTLKWDSKAGTEYPKLAAWPHAALEGAVRNWPVYRVMPTQQLQRSAVWCVPLDGSRAERLVMGERQSGDQFVSGGGRLAALAERSPASVTVWDRVSSSVRTYPFPAETEIFSVMIAGFGQDEKSVLVIVLEYPGEGQTTKWRFALWRVDVETGSLSKRNEIELTWKEFQLSGFCPPFAIEDEKGIRWVFAGYSLLQPEPAMLALIGTSEGVRFIQTKLPVPPVCEIDRDLSGVTLERLSWARDGETIRRWDFATNAIVKFQFVDPRVIRARTINKQNALAGWEIIEVKSRKVISRLEGSENVSWIDENRAEARFVVGVQNTKYVPWYGAFTKQAMSLHESKLKVWRTGWGGEESSKR